MLIQCGVSTGGSPFRANTRCPCLFPDLQDKYHLRNSMARYLITTLHRYCLESRVLLLAAIPRLVGTCVLWPSFSIEVSLEVARLTLTRKEPTHPLGDCRTSLKILVSSTTVLTAMPRKSKNECPYNQPSIL
jgi:hypothetical protein